MDSTRITQQRHANMAAIRSKDTKPEMVVRRYLWSNGFRYRLNHPRLPGKPDLVLRKYRTCIFVNGCFWHGHNVDLASCSPLVDMTSCPTLQEMTSYSTLQNKSRIENSECCKIPKTNTAFWVRKIKRNQERDIRVQKELAMMGWHSITIWECELKPAKRKDTLTSLAYTLNRIFLQDRSISGYTVIEEKPMLAAEDTQSYN